MFVLKLFHSLLNYLLRKTLCFGEIVSSLSMIFIDLIFIFVLLIFPDYSISRYFEEFLEKYTWENPF